METDNIAPGNKTGTTSAETNSDVSQKAHHPFGNPTGKKSDTSTQDRLLTRGPVELKFKVRKAQKYIGLKLYSSVTRDLDRMNRIALGQDISRHYPTHVLPPLVLTPEDPVILVRQVAGVQPEPGTAYSAITLANGDLVLTEAHSVGPPNTAIDTDTTDTRTYGHTNLVSPKPSFAETYQRTARGVFSNLSQQKAGPITFIENAYLYTSSMNIKHAQLHGHDTSLVKPGKPVLIILGDQNTPELMDDGVNMVIVLRVENASPDSLKDLILRAFKNKSCTKQGLIPPGSMILVCLPEHLLTMGQAAFNIQLEYFESWLTIFFASGKNIDLEPMPDNQKVLQHRTLVIPVFPPTKEYRRSVLSALQNTLQLVKLKRFPPPSPPPSGEAATSSRQSAPGDPFFLNYEQILLTPGSFYEKKGEVSQDYYVETMVTCISPPAYIAKKCPITVNPISVRVRTNYEFEDGLRVNGYFRSLIQVIQRVRPDIPLPDHLRMNIGGSRIAPPRVGSEVTVPLTPAGHRNEGRIVVVGNSIARLIVSCFRGRFQLDSSRLIYIRCRGPRAGDSIKNSLVSLQNLNLDRRDCVFLDLMNNTVPVTQSDEHRTPETTGSQGNRIFHLVGKVDKQKMCIPEPRETSQLLSKISEAVKYVSKTGAVCISLGVSEKFQVGCCEDPTHGLTSGETPVTLNRRIMEINTFFERSAIFNNGLLKTGTVTMFDLAPPVTPTSRPMCRHSTDMVHPTMMQLRRLCATLLAVREHLLVGRGMNAQSRSIEPSLGFEDWRTGYIQVAGTGSDRQIPRPSNRAARSYEDLD